MGDDAAGVWREVHAFSAVKEPQAALFRERSFCDTVELMLSLGGRGGKW